MSAAATQSAFVTLSDAHPELQSELARRGLIAAAGIPVREARLNDIQPGTEMVLEQAQRRVAYEGPRQDVYNWSLDGPEQAANFETAGASLQLRSLEASLKESMALDQESIALRNQPRTTVPVEAFLRPEFVEGTILRKIAPQLVFLDLAERQVVNADEIKYFAEEFSAFSDPRIREAKPVSEGGTDYPIVGGSNPLRKSASIDEFKLGIIFTKRAMMNDQFAFNEVDRKLGLVSWAMQFTWNKIYADAAANEFDTAVNAALPAEERVQEFTATNAWSTGSGTPLDDLIDAQLQMLENTDDYREPSEVWVNPSEFIDLYKDLYNQDHDWALSPLTQGKTNTINVNGMIVRAVPPNSGIPAGKGLMLDRRGIFGGPILKVYDRPDPTPTVQSTSGMVNVQRIDDNPRGSGQTHYVFSRMFTAVNQDPKSVLVLHDI